MIARALARGRDPGEKERDIFQAGIGRAARTLKKRVSGSLNMGELGTLTI